MYALYKEELQSQYSTLLGVWAIKVNETDISSGGQDLEFTITDDQLQYIESEYIKAGKIAPGGKAYFDISIDPTNTDVSIIYEITVSSDELAQANIDLYQVENYFQKDGEENKVTNETLHKDGNVYTSLIPIGTINDGYKNYIRLYFEWTNDETKNETDTVLGETDGQVLSVPVQINLKQYTGEGIGNES